MCETAHTQPVYPKSATTVSGYWACTSEKYFEMYLRFLTAPAPAKKKAYNDEGKCFDLKGGLHIKLLERTWSGSPVISYKGTKLWTVREAIKIQY